MNPADLSIADAGRAIRSGELTAVALTQACLDRIDARDDLHAFVHVTLERGLEAAKRADAAFASGLDRGPMQGIPFAVKDIIDMEGAPTRSGSHASDDGPADCDAAIVALLLGAGAVPLGKLTTYEHALVGPTFDGPTPPAVNPWVPDRITGGSSSGSAAAAAGGLVRVTIGTDTGGSVRAPAAYCGVVGLKPTFATLPVEGVAPLSPGLDHVGLLAASVSDLATVWSVLRGEKGATVTDIEALRIGYARDWFADDPAIEVGIAEVLDIAVSHLSLVGAGIDLVTLPDAGSMEAAGALMLHAESFELHRSRLTESPDRYGTRARAVLSAGAAVTKNELRRARADAESFREAVDAALEPFAAIVTACTLTTASPIEDMADGAHWTPMRTLPFNVTGHPAISVPAGFIEGRPVGLQIVARHDDEAMLLRIAAAFETATDHAVQRPPTPGYARS